MTVTLGRGFFSQLKAGEKIQYASFSLITAATLLVLVALLVRDFLNPEVGVSFSLVMLLLAVTVFALVRALKIRIRGMKRIAPDQLGAKQQEYVEVLEKLEQTLAGTPRRFFGLGLFAVVVPVVLLSLFLWYGSRGTDVSIVDYLPPAQSCDPPRETKVIYADPSMYEHFAEDDTEIVLLFNENMRTESMDQDSIRICTHFGMVFELNDVECWDVSRQGIAPEFLYNEQKRELTVSLPEGQVWGGSPGIYETHVDVLVTQEVESICGVPLAEPFLLTFRLDNRQGSRFQPGKETDLGKVNLADLELSGLELVEEDGFLVVRGLLHNRTGQVVRGVGIHGSLLQSGRVVSESRGLVQNQGRYGVLYIDEELPIEVRFGGVRDYDDYVVEVTLGD